MKRQAQRLQRHTPLRAKRWGVYSKTRRQPKRAGTARDDTPYRRFVRKLECVCLGMSGATPCRGRVEASHVAIGPDEKGTGLKVPDRHAVPHCRKHHREWDGRNGRRGMFEGWTRERRWAQAVKWVGDVQLLATPQDHDQALAFEELGLGRIVRGADGLWSWQEGPDRESEAAA